MSESDLTPEDIAFVEFLVQADKLTDLDKDVLLWEWDTYATEQDKKEWLLKNSHTN